MGCAELSQAEWGEGEQNQPEDGQVQGQIQLCVPDSCEARRGEDSHIDLSPWMGVGSALEASQPSEAGAGPLTCCDSSGHHVMDVDEQELFHKLRYWRRQKGHYERIC